LESTGGTRGGAGGTRPLPFRSKRKVNYLCEKRGILEGDGWIPP